ncbi:HAD family phosphatase [Candidatus Nomurabacteria bacterium]|nr:HAD family phosphatase [Candidatus Nomurabacteria bacterium]
MDKKITTFIFDCFGVVLSPVISDWYRINRTNKGFVDKNFQNLLKEFDLNNLSEDDIAMYFSKYEGMTLSKEKIQEEIDNGLKMDHVLVHMIQQLKNKGYKIALLTNANASFFERKVYKVHPNFKDLFNEIVISSDIGMIKPNKDIFLYTLKKIDSTPEETLFIDDGKMNVEGAINLGINGFVYTDSNSFKNYLKESGIKLENKE